MALLGRPLVPVKCQGRILAYTLSGFVVVAEDVFGFLVPKVGCRMIPFHGRRNVLESANAVFIASGHMKEGVKASICSCLFV
ncbi:uncharacterized protein BJ171DRAFT_492209 [Polychytrium aggregatum]|uniref:uncharacterized protein n=1 Tax=Polychytrium aggregatum TaxID=110093 RepID=UPI0022FDBBC0|nr:uncharacterized protein BJ171DRAFT_492209 [Polychytrium aggregatum]KAI9207950.1 hypothetical protein BJ171DRAFT_492209 [Polychytrium aggregatum]